MSNCDGSQSIFLVTTSCSIPVSVLRGAPFSLPWGSSVYSTVIATNIYGDSVVSSAGNGGVIMTYPDAPVNVVENLSARTASTLGISWQIGVNNNGASVSQYVVSMATGSGAFVVLYSGLPTFLTTVTASGLTFGTTYKFVVQSGNAFGLSAYSAELNLLCATYPLTPIAPTTVNLNSNVVVSWTAPST